MLATSSVFLCSSAAVHCVDSLSQNVLRNCLAAASDLKVEGCSFASELAHFAAAVQVSEWLLPFGLASAFSISARRSDNLLPIALNKPMHP